MSGDGHVYGPVPSRRLGRSLGVDLVPFKTCSYDCVYCQLGRTTNRTLVRRDYVATDEVLAELERKLAGGPAPDYVALAGSGEPTLHAGIGEMITRIKERTRVPVAVLTNGSLLWRREVREALREADLVLPSLDAGDERLFRLVNRPEPEIVFETMVDGLAEFTQGFRREVWLEVFLLAGITAVPDEVEKIAALVRRIGPARVQLNTVARPAAEGWARAVPAEELAELGRRMPCAVDLIGEALPPPAPLQPASEETEREVLSLVKRRPVTLTDISTSLGIPPNAVLKHLDRLLDAERVTTTVQGGRQFYVARREGEP